MGEEESALQCCRMTLVGPVASPVTSLPHTPGRDIVVIGSSEESPRTREGRLAAATLEQAMGRRSVAEAIRPIRERAVDNCINYDFPE